MIEATMVKRFVYEFQANRSFPEVILQKAQQELDNFASALESHGVRVYRPKEVDWLAAGGYTGAMPRDALMSVGNTLIESAFPWQCRRNEVRLAYVDVISELSADGVTICRAPRIVGNDTIYDGAQNAVPTDKKRAWAINNTRPAFDTADFMRFGKTIIGQISNVTNQRGIDYVRAVLPHGYTLEVLQTHEGRTTRHLDSTILPLRRGLLLYTAERVTEESLRRHEVFRDWQLVAYPFEVVDRATDDAPSYMCSKWLVLNALSLDEKRIFVEEQNVEFANWLRDEFDMEPILMPFKHVNSIGGSFHCATTDLVRQA